MHNSVLELATFYNLSPTFEFDLQKFIEVLSRSEGFKGHTGAHILEELKSEKSDTSVNGYLLVIAWQSSQHHAKAMKTEEVSESLPIVSAVAENIEMHHVRFMSA